MKRWIGSALSVIAAIGLSGCGTDEPDEASRRNQAELWGSTEPSNAQWYQGKIGENGIMAGIRVIAADSLEPVEGAKFQTILIGPDGGDGGYHEYTTNDAGCFVTNQYLYPGRYQIYIEPPDGSRFKVTQYHGDGHYLVVRSDGTFQPNEFKIAVQ